MTCPVCGGAMVKRTKYVWDGQKQKLVARVYFECPNCGTTAWL